MAFILMKLTNLNLISLGPSSLRRNVDASVVVLENIFAILRVSQIISLTKSASALLWLWKFAFVHNGFTCCISSLFSPRGSVPFLKDLAKTVIFSWSFSHCCADLVPTIRLQLMKSGGVSHQLSHRRSLART